MRTRRKKFGNAVASDSAALVDDVDNIATEGDAAAYTGAAATGEQTMNNKT